MKEDPKLWLYRLFNSTYFDTWLTISYLHRYPSTGIHYYLCSKLRLKSRDELKKYLPHLVHIMLTARSDAESIKHVSDDFLCFSFSLYSFLCDIGGVDVYFMVMSQHSVNNFICERLCWDIVERNKVRRRMITNSVQKRLCGKSIVSEKSFCSRDIDIRMHTDSKTIIKAKHKQDKKDYGVINKNNSENIDYNSCKTRNKIKMDIPCKNEIRNETFAGYKETKDKLKENTDKNISAKYPLYLNYTSFPIPLINNKQKTILNFQGILIFFTRSITSIFSQNLTTNLKTYEKIFYLPVKKTTSGQNIIKKRNSVHINTQRLINSTIYKGTLFKSYTNNLKPTISFLNELVNICKRLKLLPKNVRNKGLEIELEMVNYNLPANVKFPLIESSYKQVLNIVYEWSYVLDSAENSPYFVVIETGYIDERNKSCTNKSCKYSKNNIFHYEDDLEINDKYREKLKNEIKGNNVSETKPYTVIVDVMTSDDIIQNTPAKKIELSIDNKVIKTSVKPENYIKAEHKNENHIREESNNTENYNKSEPIFSKETSKKSSLESKNEKKSLIISSEENNIIIDQIEVNLDKNEENFMDEGKSSSLEKENKGGLIDPLKNNENITSLSLIEVNKKNEEQSTVVKKENQNNLKDISDEISLISKKVQVNFIDNQDSVEECLSFTLSPEIESLDEKYEKISISTTEKGDIDNKNIENFNCEILENNLTLKRDKLKTNYDTCVSTHEKITKESGDLLICGKEQDEKKNKKNYTEKGIKKEKQYNSINVENTESKKIEYMDIKNNDNINPMSDKNEYTTDEYDNVSLQDKLNMKNNKEYMPETNLIENKTICKNEKEDLKLKNLGNTKLFNSEKNSNDDDKNKDMGNTSTGEIEKITNKSQNDLGNSKKGDGFNITIDKKLIENKHINENSKIFIKDTDAKNKIQILDTEEKNEHMFLNEKKEEIKSKNIYHKSQNITNYSMENIEIEKNYSINNCCIRSIISQKKNAYTDVKNSSYLLHQLYNLKHDTNFNAYEINQIKEKILLNFQKSIIKRKNCFKEKNNNDQNYFCDKVMVDKKNVSNISNFDSKKPNTDYICDFKNKLSLESQKNVINLSNSGIKSLELNANMSENILIDKKEALMSWAQKKEIIKSKSIYKNFRGYEITSAIIKRGKDLRQEVLALQILNEMKKIFKEENLPIYLKTYRIMLIDSKSAIIETVNDVESVHLIKKNNKTIKEYFLKKFGNKKSEISYNKAISNFLESLIGYSLATYLLQIKDRHNGNILINTNNGRLVHVDFGFILGDHPGYYNVERAPFKLSTEYIEMLENKNDIFKSMFLEGFRALRKNSDRLCRVIEVMSPLVPGTQITSHDISCVNKYTLAMFRDRLKMELGDADLEKYVGNLIDWSMSSMATGLYDSYQYFSNGYMK